VSSIHSHVSTLSGPFADSCVCGMFVGNREAALRCLDAMEERGQGPDLQAFNHALAGTTALKFDMADCKVFHHFLYGLHQSSWPRRCISGPPCQPLSD
jgi:hypothetical protein